MNKKIFLFALVALLTSAAFLYPQTKKPKNIILLIGDGMGIGAVSSAEYLLENSQFRRFQFSGLVITRPLDRLITDSGAGASAYATGTWSKYHTVSVDSSGNPLQSLLEFAKGKKMSTGLVATSSITDATPAAFYAHNTDRTREAEIAESLLKKNVDIAIGGGLNYFIPASAKESKRKDEKNIVDSLKAKGFKVPLTYEELTKTNPADNIIALLAPIDMPRSKERNFSLKDLFDITLKKLSAGKNGFFLMTEGSQIDEGAHNNDFYYTIEELNDFNGAVKAALDFAQKDKNTLVVVLADHETGGLSISGGSPSKPIITWTTKGHTAAMIGVFAYGPGASLFTGVLNNFQVGKRLFTLLGRK